MHFTQAKSLLTKWNGMNVYRGCVHGCVYCDSRSVCYGFTHPFEDVEVKENAPELLERILRTKKKRLLISSGSMADPYQPCERELELTRRCLALIDRYGFGAAVITKSDLVLRDIDLFESINQKARAVVAMTLTIADERLSGILEPNVCPSRRRYEVLKEFQRAGVPTIVWMTPILPYITDTPENIRTLLEWCADAGVKGIVCSCAGMTLRDGDREYYYRALDRHFPGLSDIYRKQYGSRYQIISPRNDELMRLFRDICEKYNIIMHRAEDVFRFTSELPEPFEQTTLFD